MALSQNQLDDLRRVVEMADGIAAITSCPDPAEGGCMGGPIAGVGCIHEAARAIRTRTQRVIKEGAL